MLEIQTPSGVSVPHRAYASTTCTLCSDSAATRSLTIIPTAHGFKSYLIHISRCVNPTSVPASSLPPYSAPQCTFERATTTLRWGEGSWFLQKGPSASRLPCGTLALPPPVCQKCPATRAITSSGSGSPMHIAEQVRSLFLLLLLLLTQLSSFMSTR